MSDVIRYDCELDDRGADNQYATMVTSDNGDYVQFGDYEKLRKENELLRKMVDAIEFPEYGDAIAHGINGKNWFDVRKDITGKDYWE